jgi:hypothetical protein
MKPGMRRTIFGEQYHSLAVPLSVRFEMCLNPCEYRRSFRIHAIFVIFGPSSQSVQQFPLVGRERGGEFSRAFDCLVLGFFASDVIGPFLLSAEDRFFQYPFIKKLSSFGGPFAVFETFPVFRQRHRECHRGREETFFEKHVYEIETVLEAGSDYAFRSALREFPESVVDFRFIFRIFDFETFQLPGGKQRFSIRPYDVAFETSDHNPLQLFSVRHDRPREALIVQQFEQ